MDPDSQHHQLAAQELFAWLLTIPHPEAHSLKLKCAGCDPPALQGKLPCDLANADRGEIARKD
jgi:hypothetical protein